MRLAPPDRRLSIAAYLASAAFGAFWGTWGAAVARVRDQAGLDDGGLGTALLCISAGALPAMLLTGRALDRWGLRCTAPLIAALGAAGLAAVLTAGGLAGLCAGLTGVGIASGAVDVAMNSVGGRAEQRSGRPVITRAGAVFSTGVVICSLGTGSAYAAGAPTWLPFAAVLLLSVLAGAAVHRALTGVPGAAPVGRPGPAATTRLPLPPLLLLGALGALAFASENAHQSWSVVFMQDVLATGPGLSATAPAVFAATVAVTRFAVSAVSPAHARAVLVAGAAVAAAGAAVVARAPSLPAALAGLVLAAAGTGALFPTLLSIVSRNVAETSRGRATAVVTVVSYLGFLLGPVYVGLWSSTTSLRGAMLAVAALGAALAALTLPLLRLSRYAVRPR
ncbi:MFS transporter [Dactylosporangium aurantiacum]|uniref:MFS transporter n=1 Tax=Dactylosporangium aurantiacum TaxID=35754 RepID=A0A9Q9IP49_9ACTN|nr:MFS transporter [Dactylosporangium aurantiacum]MDG6107746.1 MFS transporter [Dactylosporangium aurantiacum]UWZ57470.1 MFS transporter [Dactylosporangium aurantiacum]